MRATAPTLAPPRALLADHRAGHATGDTHRSHASSHDSKAGHGTPEPQSSSAGQSRHGAQSTSAGGTCGPGADQSSADARRGYVGSGFLELRILADMFADAQQGRIAAVNRLERAAVDPEPYLPQIEALRAAEKSVGLAMRRCYRRVVPAPIIAWQSETVGVGEHILARLLGIIGDPRETTVHAWEGEGADRHLVVIGEMERSVSQLWSYCGHGDATRKRARGMSAGEAAALGSPQAKVLVRLMAEGVLRSGGPLRSVYDARRQATADRGWTPLHEHNDALRLLGKELLRQLWIVSDGGHGTSESQKARAAGAHTCDPSASAAGSASTDAAPAGRSLKGAV